MLHGLDQTVLNVVLQNHLAHVVDGRAHRRNLHQYFRAVAPVFDHALDVLQMADGAGQPVDDGLGIRVRVAVAGRTRRVLVRMRLLGRMCVAGVVQVGDAVLMQIGVVVLQFVFMLRLVLTVVLVFHCAGSFPVSV